MADDRFRDLLESPLDAGPEPRRERRRTGKGDRPWLPAAGALAVLGGFVLADDDSAPAPTTAVTTPVTVAATTPAEPFGRLPDGYIAIDDRVGARAERVLVRDDAVFVTFTLAVRRELEPTQTAAFGGGRWRLALEDGRRIEGIGEFQDPFAPGTFSVAFPAPEPSSRPVAIELAGLALRAGGEHITGLSLPDGLPFTGVPERPRIQLADGLEMVIDRVDLSRTGGELEWHLEGPEQLDAVPTATVQFFAGGIQTPNLIMQPRIPATFLGFFGTAAPPPQPARRGVVELAEPGQGRGGAPNRAEVHWVIDWLSYVPAEASLPLDGVPVVTTGS